MMSDLKSQPCATLHKGHMPTQDAISAPIPFHEPWIGREEEQAVVSALRRGALEGNGPVGRRLEAEFCNLLGIRHALLMSSCTAAFETALECLDISGGEVIMPSFGFASTAAAVTSRGARPLFVDIESCHLTLDPRRVEEAISPRTRAIVFVDYGGCPGTLDEVRALSMRHGVPLIEDAAHALGSRYRNRSLGTWGAVGCISFHQTKNVTCGEGGLFLTDRHAFAEKARIVREYGTNRSEFFTGSIDHYEWMGAGSGRMLAEPLAAILAAQMEKLPEILKWRRLIAERYRRALAPFLGSKLVRLPTLISHATDNGHLFYLILRDREDARGLIETLGQRQIEARHHFYPLHLSEHAECHGFVKQDLPVTESIAGRLVRLPIYPALTEEQQDRIIQEVSHFLLENP